MSKKNNKIEEVKNETSSKKVNFDLKDKKVRSRLYTVMFVVAFGIFFFVNNTNGEPEKGPYPPGYYEVSSEQISLADYKGKIVLLDFWATWCPPCRAGIPDLVELKKEYGDKGFEIIGISVDGITRGGATVKDVVPFIGQFKINYPIVHGDNQIIQNYGGIRAIPTSFVLDKDGKVVSRYEGLIDKSTYEKDIKKIMDPSYKNKELVQAPNFTLPLVEAK